MIVQPGTKLGHFVILSSLGKGGMGEVWRAQDTKLEREVALKFLPKDRAGDPTEGHQMHDGEDLGVIEEAAELARNQRQGKEGQRQAEVGEGKVEQRQAAGRQALRVALRGGAVRRRAPPGGLGNAVSAALCYHQFILLRPLTPVETCRLAPYTDP